MPRWRAPRSSAIRSIRFSCFDTATLAGAAFGQTVLAKAVQVCGIAWDSSEAHSAKYDAERTADIFCEVCNALDGAWRKADVRAQALWNRRRAGRGTGGAGKGI